MNSILQIVVGCKNSITYHPPTITNGSTPDTAEALRQTWQDACEYIFKNLRAGVHWEGLRQIIQCNTPAGDDIGDFTRCCLRILQNLLDQDSYAGLSDWAEYKAAVARSDEQRFHFKVRMEGRFRDQEMFSVKVLDSEMAKMLHIKTAKPTKNFPMAQSGYPTLEGSREVSGHSTPSGNTAPQIQPRSAVTGFPSETAASFSEDQPQPQQSQGGISLIDHLNYAKAYREDNRSMGFE